LTHRMRWRTLRRYTATTAVLLTSAAGLSAVAAVGTGLVSAVPASAATGCSVAYTVPSQWNVGFSVAITVTNLGSPVTSWTLGYATYTQSGEQVTATVEAYNATISPSGTITIGFTGTFTSNDTAPTAFSVNGTACA
jgi:cellulase/cellobiase CelA1